MIQELARDAKTFGERVVFVHTGGTFGLFPMAKALVRATTATLN
jgi:1-aminocyclopropane-1-carboxylate deaminase/D-cysteine desulfhydrase-like pyridoxal-dependent ACC family enzyme